MKKKAFIIMLSLFLMGCSKVEPNIENTKEKNSRMRLIESTVGWNIYADTETGVMYFDQYQGGMCVMVDAEGNPLIYKSTE